MNPARLARHPIHPMLVPLPIGLWIFSFVCDVVALFGAGGPWATISWYAMAGGLVGALMAAVPGAIDWLSLEDPPHVRGTAVTHGLLNLVVTSMYALNLWMRGDGGGVTGLPFLMSVLAIVLLGIAGWLGGDLVYVHGVGVERNAPERGAATRPRRVA